MALYVYKFGGTSVGSVERIKAVAEKVKKAHDLGDQIVVVVSAMSGETNRLVALAKEMQSATDRPGNGCFAVYWRAGYDFFVVYGVA